MFSFEGNSQRFHLTLCLHHSLQDWPYDRVDFDYDVRVIDPLQIVPAPPP